MAFRPNLSDPHMHYVVAYWAQRPGWSFIYGGMPNKEGAETLKRKFEAQPENAHLTFKIERRGSC